jgi:hypothetical protein
MTLCGFCRASIPQLLNHAFLRPSAAPSPPPAAAPASSGLTQEALQSLLRQLPMMAGAGTCPVSHHTIKSRARGNRVL